MDANDRHVIEGLFNKIRETAAQAGPRDREAEALIAERLRRQPEAAYYLAQLAVVQRQALKQAEARIAALEREAGRGSSVGGGFLPRDRYAQRPGAGPYAAPMQGGGGFLQGAMQTALGIGGGILLGNAAMSLIGGMGDVFSGHLWDDRTDAAELQDAYAASDDSAVRDASQAADAHDPGSDYGTDLIEGDSGFDLGDF